MDEQKLNILTKRQQDVWELHEQGQSRKQIAAKLGITYNAVVQHIHHAERRFHEYDLLCAAEEKDRQPADLSLTRGEVKIIISALWEYAQSFGESAHKAVNVDWVGRLPVETKLIADLHRKAQIAIYGQQLQHLFPDEFYSDDEDGRQST